MMDKTLMLGNEAVARAAYEAGTTVATAYPGTPSTEITENIAKYNEIYCEWSPNEKVALEVAIGASIAGARAICCMKHVGLNVAADPLFTASYTGVNGGLAVVVADDPGMHSSQNEQDSRWYGLSAKIPMLEPSDSAECLSYVNEAFDISERFDTPVIVRLTTRVAHSRGLAQTADRAERGLYEYKKDVGKYVMMPAMARGRHVIIERRMEALREYAESSPLNAVMLAEDGGGELPGVITSGIAWQYTLEALQSMGLTPGRDISVLKLGLVYPLPAKLIADFLAKTGRVLVVEELSPFFEHIVKSFGLGAEIHGKDRLPAVGELSAAPVRGAIESLRSGYTPPDKPVQQEMAIQTQAAPLPVRPPVLCPGCPHRSVFHVLKKLKLIVCGDIGCYTLGALPPLSAMDTCICMGASVGMAHGMDKARISQNAQNVVAVIGDSTFLHSGITGLLNVVYNKGCSTVLILDNDTTGMTGHQHHPATGYTIRGETAPRVDLYKLCGALGVNNVRVEDPFDIAGLEKAVREETRRPEPSVIIVRRPCVFLPTYEPGSAVTIDTDKCTRCRMCMAISCAAISDKDGCIQINRTLCAKCGLCPTICRFGAIVPVDGADGTGGGADA